MPAKRVVYPLFTGGIDMRQKNRYIALAASSIASYFQAGNDVPVIVAANDDMSAGVMKFLADQMKYDLTVEIHPAEEVAEFSRQNAQGVGPDNRTSVTGAKLYAMQRVAEGYDRLIVDADTLFFSRIPWNKFDHSEFAMFVPAEWENPLSVTVNQILYFRWKLTKIPTFGEYVKKLVDAHPHWGGRISMTGSAPWPNSGIVYMTDWFRKGPYMEATRTLNRDLLPVEDEGILFNYMNTRLDDNTFGYETSLFRNVAMNIPVAFSDMAKQSDPFHPVDFYGNPIVAAHFHLRPKPVDFEISYQGVVRPPVVQSAWSLDFARDSIGTGQYGTMSGIIWTYVWQYFNSMTIAKYRNGDVVAIHPSETWKGIVETFVKSRKAWFEAAGCSDVLINHEFEP